jgi:hypothetical protein
MKLYAAIDLHSDNNVTVVIDEQDQVVYQKRCGDDCRAAVSLSSITSRYCRGVDLQLVLAGRWVTGGASRPWWRYRRLPV